jgi:hypothetical protein
MTTNEKIAVTMITVLVFMMVTWPVGSLFGHVCYLLALAIQLFLLWYKMEGQR